MLLRVLANARSTDDSAVSELLASFREPHRRGEAISRGAEFAADLLAEPELESVRAEVDSAREELLVAEEAIVHETEEALAAVEDLESRDGDGEEALPEPEPEIEEEPDGEAVAGAETEPESVTGTEPEEEPEPEPLAEPPPAPVPLPPPKPGVDWSGWQNSREGLRPAPHPRPSGPPSVPEAGSQRPDPRTIVGVIATETSVLSQLRQLRSELSAFEGSSMGTLSELVEVFPDGWARRRALCALLDEGVVSKIDEVLGLVSKLGRESDRRWCLGILARLGELGGSDLERALDLVTSPSSQRRLRIAAQT
jgi:hypothetical protein